MVRETKEYTPANATLPGTVVVDLGNIVTVLPKRN